MKLLLKSWFLDDMNVAGGGHEIWVIVNEELISSTDHTLVG